MTRRPQAVRRLVIVGAQPKWIEIGDAIAGAAILVALVGIILALAGVQA